MCSEKDQFEGRWRVEQSSVSWEGGGEEVRRAG